METSLTPASPSYGGRVDNRMRESAKQWRFVRVSIAVSVEAPIRESAARNGRRRFPDSCETDARCEPWFLHKWRPPYASHMIGILGLKGLQLAMGHKDIATTSEYPHFLGGDGIKERVEASELAKFIR